jgi:WhiB family redox-sensing transcriptional regulator
MTWLMLAACAGEEPSTFDHYTFPEAQEALRICSHCRFVADCMDWVKPNKSFFDGVAAGVVWRNGYRVRADNSTREDRILMRRRGELDAAATKISEVHGQRTLPFD